MPLDFRQWDGYDPPPTTSFPNQWHVEASTTSPLAAFDLITVIVPTRDGQLRRLEGAQRSKTTAR